MNNNEFIESIKSLGINPTDKQLADLETYYDMLIEWNNKINLTRIIDKEDAYLKHFYDSLTVVRIQKLEEINDICDVGTGAGIPGIILKIFYPHLKLTLIDSKEKKLKFIDEVIKELNLKDTKTVHTRAEEYKEKYDLVVSRAVANIETLLKYTMHLLNKDGKLIAMKGDIDKELTKDVEKNIQKKYNIIKIDKFYLKDDIKRSLIMIKNK
ncbi:MAG: 16S rRNA (guanine(527)-N(7))-methyltransferase RsmG [Bacilli bacterium]|nr:16S rRNA (guanine(527)-N(7))-methyltransferase RsmG [Bacilli bacterium]